MKGFQRFFPQILTRTLSSFWMPVSTVRNFLCSLKMDKEICGLFTFLPDKQTSLCQCSQSQAVAMQCLDAQMLLGYC